MSMGHLSPDETDKILFLRLHPQDANLQNYINCSAIKIEYVGLIVQPIIVRCWPDCQKESKPCLSYTAISHFQVPQVSVWVGQVYI